MLIQLAAATAAKGTNRPIRGEMCYSRREETYNSREEMNKWALLYPDCSANATSKIRKSDISAAYISEVGHVGLIMNQDTLNKATIKAGRTTCMRA